MRIGPKTNCSASLAIVTSHQVIGMTVWGIGAFCYSDVATVFLRGLLAIVFGLVTIRHACACADFRSASAPVGCRWHGQTGHHCPDKTTGLYALLSVTQPWAWLAGQMSCAGLGRRPVAREDTGTPWASALVGGRLGGTRGTDAVSGKSFAFLYSSGPGAPE